MAILAIPKHVRDGNQCRRAKFWDKVNFICNTIMESDTMSKVNYSEEMTSKIVADYEAGLPVEDDEQKEKFFLTNPIFPFYLNACNQEKYF